MKVTFSLRVVPNPFKTDKKTAPEKPKASDARKLPDHPVQRETRWRP